MDPIVIVVYAVIILLVIGAFFAYRFFKKKIARKVTEQKALVDQHKITTSIFVIEKKKGKITDAKLPKNVIDQIPKMYKLKKMPLVTAKVGPQIVTLVCEEDVFKKIPDKKNVKVDLAGIFIVDVKTDNKRR